MFSVVDACACPKIRDSTNISIPASSGTDIHIKMFDDKIIVESPGGLPGLVRLNNIRNTHFSRNPKIAEFLKIYHYVKEFGEGVDRMCFEMSKIGLPEPEYSSIGFMTKVIVRNNLNNIADKMPINADK